MTEIKQRDPIANSLAKIGQSAKEFAALAHPSVNHPRHYNTHPSGIECIEVVQHFNFNRGNAIKYIWRADEKGNTIEDLRKARWYIDQEIKRLEKEDSTP